MIQGRSRLAPPRAVAMIEALRGLGYSTPTALADIVDNCIAAFATVVDISFVWNGANSSVTVLDDGVGMDADELELAMRLGEKNPNEERAANDLGRFGLGLKTASFSQCRRLTVASVKNGQVACLRWDLDLLGHGDDGWHLYDGVAEGSESFLESLQGRVHGTLVIWEKMDRIITTGSDQQDFLDVVDKVERHISMVFHRYLTQPRQRLTIKINNRLIQAWDPFLTTHPATWSSPVERIPSNGQVVEVQCHVLPHKDRLDTKTFESAGGPDGWTSQQGFYVYRNQRLLVAGGWLGIGRGRAWTKEEAHRLARIRVDISNCADTDWKIDIRKSTARPPAAVRDRLTRLAEDTRDRARRVFAHRGKSASTHMAKAQVLPVWLVEHFPGGIRYRIDRNHPAVRTVLEEGATLTSEIAAMLRVIEETIPVQRIWLDTSEAKETPRTGFGGEPPEAVYSILSVVYKNMVLRKHLSPTQARERLLVTEPFNSHPDLIAALPDDPSGVTV
jgi:hypothetical protein